MSRYIEIKKLKIKKLAKVPVAFKSNWQWMLSALIPRSYPRLFRASLISIAILSVFLVLPKQTRAASYTTGRFNKAISFDGSGDYVDMGDVSSTVKTVDFWVSPNTTTQKFLELNGSAYIDVTSGTVAATGFTSPVIYVDGVVSSTLTTGWHHIAVTTGTGINGNSVIVGKIGTTYFTGLIDSVRMYNRTLSASEIAAHYSLGRGKHDNYAAKIKLAADDSNSYLDESLTNGQDYLASFWYHPGEDNSNAIRFKVSGSADPIMAEHNLMASSTMGLVGAWNFEEGSSGSADGDTIVDVSGNGNNGTGVDGANNTGLSWASGKFGNTISFDGTDDYVNVADNDNQDTGGQISLDAWFKTSVQQNGKAIILHDNSAYKYEIYLSSNSGHLSVLIRTASGTTQTGVTNSVGYYADNNWHYVAGTFNRNLSSNRVKFYIDGVLVDEDNGYNEDITAGDEGIYIGRDGNGYFSGLIDSVRIYNRALTASEVYDRYKATNWHKYELSFEADQTGTHLFKFIQDGTTSGNSIVYVDNFRVDKNLADKGGMEGTYSSNIAPGWSGAGGPTVAESASSHTGSKAQSVTGGSTSQNVYQTISSGITSGNWYTFQVYGKVNSGNAYAELSGAATKTITISNTQYPMSPSKYTFKAASTSLTIELYADSTKTGTFDDIVLVELDSTSTYTDPTITTPSNEANSYSTGKWSGTQAAFLMDGGDKLRYSASGVLPNDAGTVSVWWKPVWDYNRFSENVYLINAESASANLIRLFYDKTNYYYTAQLYNGTWATVAVNSAAQTFSEDAWQHIIVSYDNDVGGSAGSVVLYVNGASSGTPYSSTNWTAQTVSDYFYVGSLFGASANTNQAGGWFDDFRIYSGQLSAANINALYGLDPNPPTTATWKRNLLDPIISE